MVGSVNYLCTPYSTIPCPADLVALYDAAPKRKIWVTSPEKGESDYQVTIVDRKTSEGAAYYNKEAEYFELERLKYEAKWLKNENPQS